MELDRSAEQALADDLREHVYALARLAPPIIGKPDARSASCSAKAAHAASEPRGLRRAAFGWNRHCEEP
jgi:hypothetical protein